ncbi:E3 ubiquitin-protein ligase RNF14-like isoform X2 [Chanodichthys erythropterus]|uniref:E3 ubiquitin-protein ligase RNF14-like isoform X2 n=1 Tax=Chanodichthys erythropterus TaxID=933992 RepID=UPI00351EA196
MASTLISVSLLILRFAGCWIQAVSRSDGEPASGPDYNVAQDPLQMEKDLREKQLFQESLNEVWLKDNSKRCPSCGTHIQKIMGCNKMTCFSCQTHFCWICLKVLNRTDPYSHFRESNPCNGQLNADIQ